MGTAFWASQMLFSAAQLQSQTGLQAGAKSASELAQRARLARRRRCTASCARSRAWACSRKCSRKPSRSRRSAKPRRKMRRAPPPPRSSRSPARSASDLGNCCIALKTGKPALDEAFGQPLFEYLGERPSGASLFSETMVGFHGARAAGRGRGLRFLGLGSIVDVGGATGNMLAHILQRASRPARRAVRPAARRRRRARASRSARRRRSRHDRARQLLRARAGGARRLPALAHHPRLDRGAVPDDPRPLPAGDRRRKAGC